MSFQVPYSSSPPSTPDRRSNNGRNVFSITASNPSTTPAGPPPSSTGSFTPAGPPPSSFLGSSMMSTESPIKPLSFSQQSAFGESPSRFGESASTGGFMRSAAAPRRSGLSNEYDVSPPKTFKAPTYDDEVEEGDDYVEDEDSQFGSYENRDTDAMEDEDGDGDEEMDDRPENRKSKHGYSQRSNSELLLPGPSTLRQSREDDDLILRDSIVQSSEPQPLAYKRIAKEIYTQMGVPPINESDDLILNTEALVSRLYDEGFASTDAEDRLHETMKIIPGELIQVWNEYHKQTAYYNSEEYMTSIGPGPRASDFSRANFIAGLILEIHHPQIDSNSYDKKPKPLPQTLLEWIDEHHDPYPSQFEEIQAHRPSPANHGLFWDTIFNGLLRGKVHAVISIMKGGGWRHARGAMDDIRGQNEQAGFTGVALANVEKVIGAATQVLSLCPALRGDWDTRGSDWTLFRLRISQSLEDLKRFAEGRDRAESDPEPEGFGMSSINGRSTYSRTARKAESQVPWSIYQHLVTFYNLVMGDKNAIIENAQDWCEATVGLLVWWDEGKDDRRLAVGRSSYRAASRETDSTAYLRKLRKSFISATSDSTDFQVNTLDPVEVSLASLFEGDNESVLGFLRGWSGPISSTVAELASLGGWLPRTEPQNLITMGSLDQDDMELLGLTSSHSKKDGIKDQTLIDYARGLTKRKQLRATKAFGKPEIVRHGWEIAFAVLGRLDSATRSEEIVDEFLKKFDLDSSETVNKLWRLLNDIGMGRHAENAAEIYADSLAEHTHNYGEALWYYALAHKSEKVKYVLNCLISNSLIQSVAYPAECDMDNYLQRLISSPKNALTDMSTMDFEAAQLLHKMLSGYATLRRFYTLRDEAIQSPASKQSRLGAIARNKEAASALMAVIASADDNIRGGLYDEGRGAVVSIDFLLALLGEAMVFVNQPGQGMSPAHINSLLKAVEDLQAVGPRVYSVATEFLQEVIASGQGLNGSTPNDMLRKSTSNASGMSSFSMVGSSMLASQLKQSMSSSGVLVKGNIKRGWDWRKGISAGTTGEDVLRILRLGLAKDLAKAWLSEADRL